MKYYIEIYAGADRGTPEFSEEGAAPYLVPSVGDLIHPAWRIAGEGAFHADDRLRVVRVEHIICAQNHKLLVFCEAARRGR